MCAWDTAHGTARPYVSLSGTDWTVVERDGERVARAEFEYSGTPSPGPSCLSSSDDLTVRETWEVSDPTGGTALQQFGF